MSYFAIILTSSVVLVALGCRELVHTPKLSPIIDMLTFIKAVHPPPIKNVRRPLGIVKLKYLDGEEEIVSVTFGQKQRITG